MWRSLLLGGVLPCLACAPIVFVVAWPLAGITAAWSALGGLAVATIFFLVGFASLRLVLATPSFTQVVGALAVFFIQVLALLALVDVIGAVEGLHGRAFAIGGLVGALAWQAGQAVVVLRSRRPIYPDARLPEQVDGP